MYLPQTDDDRKTMLQRIGARSTDELFETIPPMLRYEKSLAIPPELTELELTQHLQELAGRNQACDRLVSFLGGGCYDHFVPAVIDTIGSRSEYYTAYTPYQAEASQGTLQVGFEFQTLMCELAGLDVSNASLYEGATAVVEAAIMALNVTRRSGRILVAESVHPEYRETLATYCENLDTELVTLTTPTGVLGPKDVANEFDDTTACLIVQSPNFYGLIEPVSALSQAAHDAGALLVQSFDPVSLGLLKRPGDQGADIAVGEGQGLGTPMSFGGPFLGILACREEYVRRIPGRLVGETVDRHGNRAFVLTLQTREQHIRRDKATSNICTNQGLLALRASVHLSLLGPQGLKETAELCLRKAHYLAEQLVTVPGIARKHADQAFFKEFVIELPRPAASYLPAMREHGFHAGVPLSKFFPERTNELLVAVTEQRTKAELDAYVEAWRKVLG